MHKRPVTTLFMLSSVDGKISTGSTDEMDVDQDFPLIPGVREGLHQYYEIEQTTDLWSLNSGRVQAKMGVNERPFPKKKTDVSFVIIDAHHLTEHGVRYFIHLSKCFVLVTTKPNHPGFQVKADNFHIIYHDAWDAKTMLEELYEKYGCERLTIQSGGTLNSIFLRHKLLDFVDIVVAPVLIGGDKTPTVIDGESLQSPSELNDLGVLKLESAEVLEDSYLRLRYQLIK